MSLSAVCVAPGIHVSLRHTPTIMSYLGGNSGICSIVNLKESEQLTLSQTLRISYFCRGKQMAVCYLLFITGIKDCFSGDPSRFV